MLNNIVDNFPDEELKIIQCQWIDEALKSESISEVVGSDSADNTERKITNILASFISGSRTFEKLLIPNEEPMKENEQEALKKIDMALSLMDEAKKELENIRDSIKNNTEKTLCKKENDLKVHNVIHNTTKKLCHIVPIKEENIRFNDLGLPMHPLEIEVADMVERAQRGEKLFDGCSTYTEAKEKFDDIKNTVDFLKKYFGKYLNVFNGGNGDYLYQVDLQKIDAKFRNSLRMYLSGHGQDINNIVPNISDKCDKEADVAKEQKILSGNKKFNKINSLRVNRGLKAG